MTSDQLVCTLESLLFVAAEPVEVSQLAGALGVSAAEVEGRLAQFEELCRTRGVRLQRKGQRVQLATAPESSPFVEKFLGLTATTRLSQAALETLAIIAYRQPITRAEIEAIRAVDCDGVLRTLVARELIAEVERLDTVGHPIRYGTTFEFLRYLGLQRMSDLPPLDDREPAMVGPLARTDD
ncbi:MAG: SMC-Scp complex subunit ScpB [Chloroflexi bacterium]|nr:SMC-Scp complex subunit ScpB [Chloroflexota bacterium]MBI3732750.1 SMC-Scp complex subunit ScpB [Chloroflexota bacterium]